MDAEVVLFSITFVCLSFMFGVCPPQEFWSSGITLENAISRWLGNEEQEFTLYNIRRLSATVLFQACLPLLYLGLLKLFYEDLTGTTVAVENTVAWSILVLVSVLIAVAVGTIILYFRTLAAPLWSNSPTARVLGKFATHLRLDSWFDVAKLIDGEYKELDKFTSILSGWNARTVVTRSWIIRLGQYRVDFARQDLCQLEVIRADNHSVSQQGDVTGAQYVTIKVHSQVAGVADFFLRLNSREFEDFKRHVVAPIVVPNDIVLVKSVVENFVSAFRKQVSLNDKIRLGQLQNRELETCVGCYVVPANVKLTKCCEGATCVSCQCRPMWCSSCMGMWFAHQQNQHVPESWMSGTAPCPNCRSVFCVLDVCPIES